MRTSNLHQVPHQKRNRSAVFTSVFHEQLHAVPLLANDFSQLETERLFIIPQCIQSHNQALIIGRKSTGAPLDFFCTATLADKRCAISSIRCVVNKATSLTPPFLTENITDAEMDRREYHSCNSLLIVSPSAMVEHEMTVRSEALF